ncbi:hypothetical protein BV20DRAFT_1093373 [Pilatotrama ljubarskyi]|nr:hypothetical protein BV20DRAFT_1093373 [Pilatotrama ljubarskyi]
MCLRSPDGIGSANGLSRAIAIPSRASLLPVPRPHRHLRSPLPVCILTCIYPYLAHTCYPDLRVSSSPCSQSPPAEVLHSELQLAPQPARCNLKPYAMTRGRRATNEQVPCPHCGIFYKKNGLAAHMRACQRQGRIAADGVRLAALAEAAREQQLNASTGSSSAGPAVNNPLAQPPVAYLQRADWGAVNDAAMYATAAHGKPLTADAEKSWTELCITTSANAGDSDDQYDRPPQLQYEAAEATAGAGPLEAVFLDAPSSESDSSVPSTPPPGETLHLPTFRPPTIYNAPAELIEDDFLTVYHPHARQAPTIHHFEEFSRARPDPDPTSVGSAPWAPYQSLLDFKFAEFALEASLNQGKINKLLELIKSIVESPSEFTFETYTDVKRAWETASTIAPAYEKHEVKATYHNKDYVYTMYCRSLFEWSLSLVKDPVLAPKFNWHARRLYKYNGTAWERFVDDPDTADAWWNLESLLPPEGCPLVYTLYADKTRLSSFGSKKGYPIIARINNLPVEIRNSSGYGGGQVMGFLPIVEDEDEEGKSTFTNFKRAVWHEAFWHLLKSTKLWAETGYSVKCGDGITRLLFPVVLILVADYEEQAMMSLTRGAGGLAPCPVCLVEPDQQRILSIIPTARMRDQAAAEQILAQKGHVSAAILEEQLRPLGLRPIKNVFWQMPHCDVYKALSWDRLHAYHGGLFSDHLFDEFQQILKDLGRPAIVQVNEQFDALPRWRDLNHFMNVAKITFTDGTKYEDISKVIVPASYNVMIQYQSQRGIQLEKCLRRYIVLDVLAGLEVHLASTLQTYATELVKFSSAIQVCHDIHPEKSWNFPKAHTHQHLIDDIIAKGVTKNTNSKPFEGSHVELKDIYGEQTNFKEVDSQISQIEHHISIIKILRARIDTLDDALHRVGHKPEEDSKADPFQFHHVHLGARSNPITFAELEAQQPHDSDLRHFRIPLQNYLSSKFAAGAQVRISPHEEVSEYAVIEARYLKVDYESTVTWRELTDHLRCNPIFQGAPRYDYILYRVDDKTIGFAQLKLVFIYTFRQAPLPLALVRCLKPVRSRSAIDRELGLLRLRPHDTTEFIPVESILRGAMVAQDFGTDGHYLAIDTVDGDMFVRLRQHFPGRDL